MPPAPSRTPAPAPAVPTGLTFLEYLVGRELGPPTRRRGNGESCWDCPACGNTGDKFHTLPHDPNYKHRFRCHACDARGDEYDLLRMTRLGVAYPEQRVIVGEYRAEFDRLTPTPRDDPPETAVASSSSPRTGDRGRYDTKCYACRTDCRSGSDRYDPRADECQPETEAAADALDALLGSDPAGQEAGDRLTFAAAVLRVTSDHRVHPAALAGQIELRECVRRTDQEHRAGCRNPHCDAMVCRKARGWTDEQIRKAIARRQAAMVARWKARGGDE